MKNNIKHKIVKTLTDIGVIKTAWENMINNGYNRIWDCGNAVWVWVV